MSWGVSAVGKAGAVRKAIADQFAKSTPCAEPEESVRLEAAATIAQALAAQDANTIVKVAASGSMGFKDYGAKTGPYNSLAIAIEPMHGFIE